MPPIASLFVALLTACSGSETYTITEGADFLVVARYEATNTAITETHRRHLGWEVATTGPYGNVTLHPPRQLGETVTHLTVAKPGHELLEVPSNARWAHPDRRYSVPASRSWHADRTAQLRMTALVAEACGELPEDQCSLLRRHAETWSEWLEQQWPAELASEEERFARHPLRVVQPAWPDGEDRSVFGAAPVAGGDLFVVSYREGTGHVSLVNPEGQITAERELDSIGALARTEDGLWTFDELALVCLDEALGERHRVPIPEDVAQGVALAVLDSGFAVASPSGTLWILTPEGRVRSTQELGVPVEQIIQAPDGTLWVLVLDGTQTTPQSIGGLHVVGRTPTRCLARVGPAGLAVVQCGVDALTADELGMIGLCHEVTLSDEAGRSTLDPRVRQRALLRLSWEGEVLSAHTVSDTEVPPILQTMGPPLRGERLVLNGGGIVTLAPQDCTPGFEMGGP